ncbi:hypothetical protein KEM52_003348 [Ascosphaera acerosa]|nr:hypothetical protein KEM52_003348 [Ascosphaera acerosa]
MGALADPSSHAPAHPPAIDDGSTTPKTPGALFALRAFRDIWAGTSVPATDDDLSAPIQSLKASTYQRSGDNILRQAAAVAESTRFARLPSRGRASRAQHAVEVAPNGSPTKGILYTPGTTGRNRKTVSFRVGSAGSNSRRSLLQQRVGEGQQQPQEQERQASRASHEAGSVSAVDRAAIDGAPHHALKQAGMHFKDRLNALRLFTAGDGGNHSTEHGEYDFDTMSNDDVTTDLMSPQSQSGKFWKNEYEAFRAKTVLETRRLIEYRSAAKRYARTQVSEVQRLERLTRSKDATIAGLQSQLRAAQAETAGTRASENAAARWEQRAKESERELERQRDENSRKDAQIDDLKRNLEEMTRAVSNTQTGQDAATSSGQEPAPEERVQEAADGAELRALVQLAEQRAAQLRDENQSLKRMLARVKTEMASYEARRRAKEERLKAREANLESRVHQLKQELRQAKQEAAASATAARADGRRQVRRVIRGLRRRLAEDAFMNGGVSLDSIDDAIRKCCHGIVKVAPAGQDTVTITQGLDVNQSIAGEATLDLPPVLLAPNHDRTRGYDEAQQHTEQESTAEKTEHTAEESERMPLEQHESKPNDTVSDAVLQTPRPSALLNRKANPHRFTQNPAVVSLTPQGPASAKKATMSAQRIRAAEARLRLRGRGGVR